MGEMTSSISYIFGGEAKVKTMRLFVFNPGTIFTSKEVAERVKERSTTARKEMNTLMKVGLIKKRSKGFTLDNSYMYLDAVRNFLLDAPPVTEKELVKKLSDAGTLKLVLIAGNFIHEKDSRVDILVVGDHLKQNKLYSIMSSIEARLGKELRYASFETVDFQYRFSIYDKLIRDIMDSNHKKILNKIGL